LTGTKILNNALLSHCKTIGIITEGFDMATYQDPRTASQDLEKTYNRAVSAGADHMDDFKKNASDAVGNARDAAGNAMEGAKAAAGTAFETAKTSAAGFASETAGAFKSSIEEHKTAGASAIADAARSAREAADGFEDQAPQVASVIRGAAGAVERVSNDIKDRSVNELMDSVTDFAQRQPLAFFGCGIVAGLIVSRLLSGTSKA
jgi:methyl-accepting chemotaxis protein